MNEEQLRSALPGERPLPPDRRAQIKEMLMSSLAEPTTKKRSNRRRMALGAVAALATAGVATAAAAGVISRDRPDPVQVEAVNRELGSGSPMGSVHTEGWRPELNAETVECELAGGLTITWASEFPLEEQLTEQHLVDECTSGNDLVRSRMGAAADTVTVCVRRADYPRPVVLADGSTCADQQLRPIMPDDLADLNRRRAFDVSLLAVPTANGCPSLDEAIAWSKRQVRESAYELHIDSRDEGDSACYRGVTDWSRNVILVQALGPQSR